MPKMKLLPQTLAKLAPGPGGQRVSYYDSEAPGLVLRVGDGTRVFYFDYSFHGASKRMRLGDLNDDVTLSERREEVRRFRGKVSAGIDPLEERRRERAIVEGGESFATLGERALTALEKRLRAKTTDEWRRVWAKHLLPAMGDVDAGDPVAVKRAALKMGDALVEEGRLYGANRTLELARRIMSFAVATDRDGRYPANPLLRISKPHVETARTRRYSDDEVRAIVAGAIGTLYEDVVPLLLATGVRAGEVLAAEWVEFDGNTWDIPAKKSKIKHDRPVHLNRYALEVLERVRKTAKMENGKPVGFLFPARSVSGHRERMEKEAYRIRAASGVADFALHDLRRVVRTGLSELGVPTDVGELCLGHLPPKMVRIYNPHPTFWKMPEQRKVMDCWGARLERMLSGEERGADVLPMVRA